MEPEQRGSSWEAFLKWAQQGPSAASVTKFTLPRDDPCFGTVEAFKSYAGARMEEYMQAVWYQRYAGDIEEGQHCCPSGSRAVDALRPGKTDPQALQQFVLLGTVVPPDSACRRHLPIARVGDEQSIGKSWYGEYERVTDTHWQQVYTMLSARLRGCCSESNAVDCGRRISESQAVCTKQALQAASSFQTALAQEREKCEEKIRLASDEKEELLQERHKLHVTLARLEPRPGTEVLAGFPAGSASVEVALYGGAALFIGFLLGLPGRHAGWAKLVFGTGVALISLCIYLGIVYLLPDTRPTDLLLAVAGALLFASLQALLHLHLSPVRRQGQALNRFSQWRPPRERQAAPAIPEPGRRTRWRPSPARAACSCASYRRPSDAERK